MKRREPSAAQEQLSFETATPDPPAHPFIKWAGGKRQLVPELLRRLPKVEGTYFEPFLGGGALYFALRPQRAVLADVNERLVRTYRGVAEDVEGVIAHLAGWPHERDFFYELRKADTSAMSDAALAAWFIYLNRTSFNGLYRVNRQNEFNVPFGDYVNPKICDANVLRTSSKALKSAQLLVADFEEAVRDAKRGDVVYFDPPYVPISEYSDFTRYSATKFGPDEQRRLRDLARTLKQRGVTVLLSNSSAPAVYELYRDDFSISRISVRRAVSGKTSGRGPVDEVLIS